MKISASIPFYNRTIKYQKLNNNQKQTSNNNTYSALDCISTYNISFMKRKPIPVYVISKDRQINKVNSIEEASELAEISAGYIQRKLQNQKPTTKGNFIIKASEVERQNEDGTISLDKDKLDEIFEILDKVPDFEPDKHKKLYVIQQDGSYQKYDSVQQAAEEVGLAKSRIYGTISSIYQTARNMGFVYASDFEIKQPDGSIEINETKLNEILKNIKTSDRRKNSEKLYIISPDGHYERLDSLAATAEELNTSKQAIHNVVAGRRKDINGIHVVRAEDIETTDENGQTIVDKNKLNTILNTPDNKPQRKIDKEIYLVHSTGKYKKFKSVVEAAQKLQVSESSILNVVAGRKQSIKGFGAEFADNIEKQNESGEVVINKESLQRIARSLQRNSNKNI